MQVEQIMRDIEKEIFEVDHTSFETVALKVFHYQAEYNPVYTQYLKHLEVDHQKITQLSEVPFLPIEFFKTHKIITSNLPDEACFLSSATTSGIQSKHYVAKLELYKQSFSKAFKQFYGNINDYVVLALLPSYLEREGSSLILMVQELILQSDNNLSGFFLYNTDDLLKNISLAKKSDKKILLIGVSFALLDLAESTTIDLSDAIIMETGGMKGRRKELIREELHEVLCNSFNTKEIHSEYGMTELLSQAYSNGNGVFSCPPWMNVFIREMNDPFTSIENGKTGALNIIDLANLYSCSFIATQDIGKKTNDKTFTVLGRYDTSDVRGCNLMVF